MNDKGFVTSALLYGILSLFFILIIGTISAVSNKKLASDRLRESALTDVENLKTSESCFEINNSCVITGYKTSECGTSVFVDANDIRSCTLRGIGANAFSDISNGYVYIKSSINIDDNAFSGNSNVTFITVDLGTANDGQTGTIWGATGSYLKAY